MRLQATATTATELKPLRLNFAGVCIYCETRWCQSAECVAKYARSVWEICPRCDGTGTPTDDQFGFCWCIFGLSEASAAGAAASAAAWAASAPSPVRDSSESVPVSVPPVFVSSPLPRCLTCGHRTATRHEACRPPVDTWQPCGDCAGLRTDRDGFECQTCCGVGFIPMSAHDTLAERAGEVTPW